MAKRRNRRPSKNKIADLPKAAETIAFNDVEEDFFRAGAEGSFAESTETRQYEERPSLWRRLFARAA